MKLNFPKDFFWGAATASHQVEGNNNNDWSQWEKKNASRLADLAEKRYSKFIPDWELFKNETVNPLNYISGVADDQYNKFEEDFDIAQSLGMNAHRFSIEWSRIEPEEGKFSKEALEHYRKVIQSLRKRKIEPFLTLWHWTVPLWFRKKGGWTSKKSPEYFSKFVEEVVKYLGSEVKYWIILNEPQVYTAMPFAIDQPPPEDRNPISYLIIRRNLVRAHKLCYQLIKKKYPYSQVGVANSCAYFEPFKNRLINRFIAYVCASWWNSYFPNKMKDYQDFIGLNFYFRRTINFGLMRNNNVPLSDKGWELYPKGIYFVLKELHRHGKPVYITEHGLADAKDKYRAWYLTESLKAIKKAIDEGVDVRGYFHWTLIDNFEWGDGFWPRFGLIEVDYKTQKRTIRPSARVYSKIMKANSIEIG